MTSITDEQRATLSTKLPGSGILSLGYDVDVKIVTVQTEERAFTVFANVSPTDFDAVCKAPELTPALAPMLNFKPKTRFIDATLNDYTGVKPTEFVECPSATD